jgi:hypothetical protein
MEEKENRRRAELQSEKDYAQQTLELTNMRSHLEYDFLQKKKDKEAGMISENNQKMEAFKQLEKERDAERLELERQRVALLLERGQKQLHQTLN